MRLQSSQMCCSEETENGGMLKFEQNGVVGCSITDLPESILGEVILKLPIKGMVICKGVCKAWHHLISEPDFAKQQFARAKPYLLLRLAPSYTSVSRILYVVELPEIKLEYCFFHGCGCFGRCYNEVNMKLKTKFKIPLRNGELLLNNIVSVTEGTLLPKGVGLKRKRCVNLHTFEHKSGIVNSCNGFMCLSETARYYPVIVCNPVTGEFINLPKAIPGNEKKRDLCDSGFGFSPKTNQYKVIRMFEERTATHQCMRCPVTGKEVHGSRVAEIHTLGTESWKRIGYAPYSSYRLQFPTYLNGALHWLITDLDKSDFIVSFDMSMEQFQLFPSPRISMYKDNLKIAHSYLGVLNGCLCVSDASSSFVLNIWVMRVYGSRKTWTMEYCIDADYREASWPYGIYQPLYEFSDGLVLIFHHERNALIYYHRECGGFNYFKIQGYKSMFEAVVHIPSLISLRDAVVGDNLEVLNVNSRCGEFKLRGEVKPVCLKEYARHPEALWRMDPVDR